MDEQLDVEFNLAIMFGLSLSSVCRADLTHDRLLQALMNVASVRISVPSGSPCPAGPRSPAIGINAESPSKNNLT